MGASNPKLFVVSGPSGAGKGTLVALARERLPRLGLTVSATTRDPRPGEVEGESYHFMDEDEFRRRVAAGEFLEWAEVHGHLYGTLASEVEKRLASGLSVILEIDVQGALQIRESFPGAVLLFIAPPSLEVLRERLEGRGTESAASLETRLANAHRELAMEDRYDAVIVNDDLDAAVDELVGTISAYERK